MTLYVEDAPRAERNGEPMWRLVADSTAELVHEAGDHEILGLGGSLEFALIPRPSRDAAVGHGAVELTESGVAHLVIAKAQRFQAGNG